ncbi:hypothetical protein SDC9_94048 [bioreactor metagenome]|uniref:Uncharacterized protein n=1 Tax=bioreactor metagenome TaxID=1076179 RepID=A0A645A2B1_9ZZZZ
MSWNENEDKARTSTLLRQLFKAPDLDSFFDRYEGTLQTPELHNHLITLCEERGLKKDTVIKNAGIERTYGYQIFNGTRKPSRDKVLQIALAMRLNMDETQKLLRIADKSLLYPRLKRDAAVIYCVVHGLGCMSAQNLLDELGLHLLGDETAD